MNGRKEFSIRLVICVLMLTLALAVPAGAVTRYVSPGQSIQAAINDANDGDEIEVAPGTYNEAINFGGKAVRLYSSGGPDVTTIDANDSNNVVMCVSSEDADTILEGFTITGGNAKAPAPYRGDGGGMYCVNSSPTVTNCIFTGNQADNCGGGMYNGGGSPAVTNCIFTGNQAEHNQAGYGGGMYNSGGSPTVTNCIFTGNQAYTKGGGMCNRMYCSPAVTNCNFSNNTASFGGGMYNEYYSSPTVTNCNFTNNTAGFGCGGGIYNLDSSNPTVTNCIFTGNQAYTRGGGMYNNSSNPTVTNCIFTGNSADTGGGMDNFHSSPTVTNCTFSGNTAIYFGGGMDNDNSNPTVTNCILWGDSPQEIINNTSSATVTYSNVEGGWPDANYPNIDADPCFAIPGYWDPNGTPEDANDDFWIEGDYHLKSEAGRWDPDSQIWVQDDVNSPCIDTGDPNSDWTAELWPHGEHINMGAYGGTPEASMSLSDIGNIRDLNIDGGVSSKDMKLLSDKWLYEVILLPEDLSRDGVVNFTDVAILANDWGLPCTASNPNPTDGAIGVSTTTDLSWTAGCNTTSHDVYFGTSNPPPFKGNQTTTIFDPGEMDYSTTYYWRIDEVNSSWTTKGKVWSFTTHSSPPP